MGYSLVRDDDDSTSMNILGWHVAINLALLGGWKPLGAVEAPHRDEAKRPPSYFDGQFSDTDARAFALGLRTGIEQGLIDRAVDQTVSKPQGVMAEIAAFMPGATFPKPEGEWDERLAELADFASRGRFFVGL